MKWFSAAVAGSLVLGALGCAAKSTTQGRPAAGAVTPPATLDLTLNAEVPRVPTVLSVTHDAGGGKKPGETVTFTSKAVVPPGDKLQVNVVGSGWTVPMTASGQDTWSATAAVPNINSGSYNVQARLLDASGAEVSQALASGALVVKPSTPPCELLTTDLGAIRVPFDFDDAGLSADAKAQIENVAAAIKRSGLASFDLTIDGHCDERGTTKYNLALGERRARTVRDYLATLGLVDAKRVKTVSYGEERPIDSGHDENAWKQNRRAEFKVACSQ